MKNTAATLLTTALIACSAGYGTTPAYAETVLEVTHAYGVLRERFFDTLAEEFMKQHPDIKISFRAPAADYYEGHLAVVREALTGSTPDVFFSGMNLLPDLASTLGPRTQIVDLQPFLDEQGQDWIDENYDSAVLGLGNIDGHQWGMAFNASTPIVYYNADLVKQAGGDPDHLPTTWDETIDLARKIKDLGSDIDGIQINLSLGDWFWQAMLGSFGGTLMNPERTEVTYGGAAGLKTVETVRRLVEEVDMPWVNEGEGLTQFVAGKLGIFTGSTAHIKTMITNIGGKFDLRTGSFPLGAEDGVLPTGGSLAVLLAKDPEKQKAGWKFIEFLTSAEGQKITVLGSGYMPTNKKALEPEYLGDFYEENPFWTTSIKQWPIAVAWFGYPNVKSVEVWEAQSEVLFRIGRGEVSPEEGLEEMVASTEAILDE